MANELELADLVIPGGGDATICMACQWRCSLAPGETGHCQVRVGTEVVLSVIKSRPVTATVARTQTVTPTPSPSDTGGVPTGQPTGDPTPNPTATTGASRPPTTCCPCCTCR